ncbi:MAG: hypothetical protein Q7S15_00480 [bacterium]|nr:hypothetical protein [bacterium]
MKLEVLVLSKRLLVSIALILIGAASVAVSWAAKPYPDSDPVRISGFVLVALGALVHFVLRQKTLDHARRK